MVVHKVPMKHNITDEQQIPQMVVTQQQPTGFHRSSKPIPLVRQAPVFDLEVITTDNFVPWVSILLVCRQSRVSILNVWVIFFFFFSV